MNNDIPLCNYDLVPSTQAHNDKNDDLQEHKS